MVVFLYLFLTRKRRTTARMDKILEIISTIIAVMENSMFLFMETSGGTEGFCAYF